MRFILLFVLIDNPCVGHRVTMCLCVWVVSHVFEFAPVQTVRLGRPRRGQCPWQVCSSGRIDAGCHTVRHYAAVHSMLHGAAGGWYRSDRDTQQVQQ